MASLSDWMDGSAVSRSVRLSLVDSPLWTTSLSLSASESGISCLRDFCGDFFGLSFLVTKSVMSRLRRLGGGVAKSSWPSSSYLVDFGCGIRVPTMTLCLDGLLSRNTMVAACLDFEEVAKARERIEVHHLDLDV